MALLYGTTAWEEAYQEILQRRLRIASRPYVIGTPEWVDAYEKAVQEDEKYREVAAGWEGTVVLHTLADPENGAKRDIYILMDLWHGDCRSMRLVPPHIGEAADYVIAGSPLTWKRLGNGGLDTNKAVMQGKLKIKGDLGNLVRYGQASARLGQISAKLKGRSPMSVDGEEACLLEELDDEFAEVLLGMDGHIGEVTERRDEHGQVVGF